MTPHPPPFFPQGCFIFILIYMWAFIVEKHSQLLLIDNSFEGMPLGSLNALPCTTMSLWKKVFVYDADS